jgi:hypothetical protein
MNEGINEGMPSSSSLGGLHPVDAAHSSGAVGKQAPMLQVDTPDGLFGGGSSGPAGVMGEE